MMSFPRIVSLLTRPQLILYCDAFPDNLLNGNVRVQTLTDPAAGNPPLGRNEDFCIGREHQL